MCEPTTLMGISLAGSAISGGLGVASTSAQSSAQQAQLLQSAQYQQAQAIAAKREAAIAADNADRVRAQSIRSVQDIEAAGDIAESNLARQVTNTQADFRARSAARGLNADVETGATIQGNIDELGARDTQLLRANVARQSFGVASQAHTQEVALLNREQQLLIDQQNLLNGASFTTQQAGAAATAGNFAVFGAGVGALSGFANSMLGGFESGIFGGSSQPQVAFPAFSGSGPVAGVATATGSLF